MKFDTIIGNPPYQKACGDDAKLLVPVYQSFIEKALELNSSNISFIVPSRWMQGGLNLDQFRFNMMQLNKFKYMIDFQRSETAFPNMWIDGGICYFLIQQEYNGKTLYKYIDKDGNQETTERYLRTNKFDFVIRDHRQLSIIEKAMSLNELTFAEIVGQRNCYGIDTGLFNNPENYPEADLRNEETQGYYKIYGVLGEKNAVRVHGWIHPEGAKLHKEFIGKYNIFLGYAYNIKSVTPAKRILSVPGELCTGTFLNIGPFETKEQQLNCEEYIKTKFFRALLYFHRFQKNSTYKTFELIPLQDFSITWTDEMLYSKYNLSEQDISYINNLIEV